LDLRKDSKPIPQYVLDKFRLEVQMYYEDRVRSVIAHNRNSLDLMLDLEFAARLILGGRSLSTVHGVGFEAAGLLTSEGKFLQPAKVATLSVFRSQRKDLIRELVCTLCLLH